MKVEKHRKVGVSVAGVVPHIKTGRRKRAVATAMLYSGGEGAVVVNGQPLERYFYYDLYREKALLPFSSVGVSLDGYNLCLRVNGGGLSAQSSAVSLAVARVLLEEDPDRLPALKELKLLTSDGRRKERKKFGRKKARKSRQFSKR